MSLYQLDPSPTVDDDASTVNGGAVTPPETVADTPEDLDPVKSPKSSVPWPGNSYIIRSAISRHVLTLIEGQVILAPPSGKGSIHWACVQTKGWLGFKNTASGSYLGHGKHGNLICSAGKHQSWENFCVRMTPDGDYILLMTHFERLWHVGSKNDKGKEKLAKIGENMEEAIIWEFIKV
ncbi:hypothetical protein IFR04_001928 [Cadophora malorum]|uniref:Uncharacterized protein n=1 Tax=Cadophora malorum TaxID=108018 RepID=A0A8H8BV21_9HELO|nr:hypothetical protein IFR04_001928 [Cadophora malorum]